MKPQQATATTAVPKTVGKPGKANPISTQNTLQIAEIRDGLVIMNDGTFRTVIMCQSINFDLMSPQEREAVEFSYQGFLNSLEFPIQIFMRSEKIDIRPYLEKLNKIRTGQDNMLLALLMEDYISFLAAIAQQTNIMDKQFYLVISYPDPNQNIRSTIKQSAGFFTGMRDLFSRKNEPHVTIDTKTLAEAKGELTNRVQSVIEGLLQCGVQCLPLDTEELIELYYNVYNPDTSIHQRLAHSEQLQTPVIQKGQGDVTEKPVMGAA